ncbi:MAG: hypothetical protein ACRD9W_20010, partial [Terriglobia bacterium]
MVGRNGVGDCVGTDNAGRGSYAQSHALACDLNGLPIGQNRYAIGIGEVVGMADGLLLVTSIADIVTRDPRTGGAIGKAPIAEVEAAFDGAEIGLGTWGQAPARVLGIQKSVQHAARHVVVFPKPQAACKRLHA